ncbi:gene transfer agent family protein [Chthonobacter rhizosphaerae]|uniref:gene transfer agent family protein n=1 Tax=Chthonobacter rhizosphaerae TaxID=2735553 RepID=UPI0015EF893F
MANRHRGEIAVTLDGRERRLRLTLGALADLETALGAADMGDLARRFAAGRLRARDAVAVLAAGLRGAGEAVSDREVAAMAIDGGAPAYAAAVAELLAATFGGADDGGGAEPTGPAGEDGADRAGGAGPAGEDGAARPFPGTTPSRSASAS